jgi:MFS transporter, NNP family, nitrate/nitrite transporter
MRESAHIRHEPATIAAGIALGAATTWNVSSTGAAADPLADAYGVSLALVGLLTTALFVTHLAAQLPAGHGSDRLGARRIGLVALAAAAAGNTLALLADVFALGLFARLVTGIGTGAGFVAGLDLVRAGGGGPTAQGFYGGGTMAGGGLAIAIVPLLDGPLGWRAPYWTGLVLALGCLVPMLLAPATTPSRGAHRADAVLRDRRLLPLGAVQAATFGLSVVAGNWVVTLLERQGVERSVAGIAGSLILFAGVLTRPSGGLIVRRRPDLARRIVAACLVAAAAGAALLAAGDSFATGFLGSALLGLAVGMPFAAVMSAAQRLRPETPAAAVGFVNAVAVLTILVGTPLAGLAFSLPSDGRLAFAAIAALMAAALVPLSRARI